MSQSYNRYDVLVCCEDLNLKLAPKTAEALLRHLAITRILIPTEESVAENWAEIYMTPGASAHEPFTKGARPDVGEDIFLQGTLRLGTDPVALDYGPKDKKVSFFLEFRGALFDDVQGPFRKKFQDICKCRCVVFTQPHDSLREIRPVPEGEEPQDKRKKNSGGGQAGVRVEEF